MMPNMPTTTTMSHWKREGRAQGAQAMLVVWDTFPWPWEPHPVFVLPGEALAARFAEYDGPEMQRVSAVYPLRPRP